MDRPVSIHIAKPGDILASEVITAAGNVVMPSGVMLTSEMLDHLKRLDVYTLVIRK